MGGEGCAGLGKFANITERERERGRGIIATSQTRSDQHLQPPDRGQREVRAEKMILPVLVRRRIYFLAKQNLLQVETIIIKRPAIVCKTLM